MPKRRILLLLAARLKNELEVRLKNYPGPVGCLAGDLLLETVEESGGRGVGGVLNREKGIDLLYIDQGDAFRDTIIFDVFMEKFLVAKWGELLEIYEMLHEQEIARDQKW
jgi:hypothetical protein